MNNNSQAYSKKNFEDLVGALARISDTPILVLDRSTFPHEEKFAHDAYYVFSEKERKERASKIRDQVANAGYILVKDMEIGAFGQANSAIAKDHKDEEKNIVIIVVNSPCLSDEGFWKAGLPYSQGKSIEGITKLHELMHLADEIMPLLKWLMPLVEQIKQLMPVDGKLAVESLLASQRACTLQDLDLLKEIVDLQINGTKGLEAPKTEDEQRYNKEATADVLAIKYYLKHNGCKAAVENFIRFRHISGFLNRSPSKYWTGPALECTLRNQPIYPYQRAFDTVRELQMGVFNELIGSPKASNALFVDNPEFINSFMSGKFYKEYSLVDNIGALDRIVQSANLSEDAKLEGARMLRAFQHFSREIVDEAKRSNLTSRRATSSIGQSPSI